MIWVCIFFFPVLFLDSCKVQSQAPRRTFGPTLGPTSRPTFGPSVVSGRYNLVKFHCTTYGTYALEIEPLQTEDYYIKMSKNLSSVSPDLDGVCEYKIPAIDKGSSQLQIEYPVIGDRSCGSQVEKSSDGLTYEFSSFLKIVYDINQQFNYHANLKCSYPVHQTLDIFPDLKTPGDTSIDLFNNGTWSFNHSFFDTKGQSISAGQYVEPGTILTLEIQLLSINEDRYQVNSILGKSSEDGENEFSSTFYDRTNSVTCNKCVINSDIAKKSNFKLPMQTGLDKLLVNVEIFVEGIYMTVNRRFLLRGKKSPRVENIQYSQSLLIQLPPIRANEFLDYQVGDNFQGIMIASFLVMGIFMILSFYIGENLLVKDRERFAYYTVVLLHCFELLGIVASWYWLDNPTKRCERILTSAWSIQFLLTCLVVGSGFFPVPDEKSRNIFHCIQFLLDLIEISCLTAVEAYCEDGIGPAIVRIFMFFVGAVFEWALMYYHWKFIPVAIK